MSSLNNTVILYAAPMSLYSGKVRSYLRKHGIAFDEVMPGQTSYRETVYPQTKRGIVPVIQFDDGSIIQDSVDIIDHFERSGEGRFSVYPQTPRQLSAALMLDMFGSEGLLKVAMHYRWNFLDDNLDFIRQEFGDHILPGGSVDAIRDIAEVGMKPMQAYLPLLGIDEHSIPAIEAQYHELLALLNAHFQDHPYLLGGLPSVADYGLFAPLYAHLSRDPHPAHIMKQKAQRVYRWIERMNAENRDMPEFGDYPEAYFANDEIPETLQAILAMVGRDYLPELTTTVNEIDTWLASHSVEPGDCVTAKPKLKALKPMRFNFRGIVMTGMVIPYRLYMLQRITACFDQCSDEQQQQLREFYQPLGLAKWLTLKASRRVERPNHFEVWGECR